MHHQGLPDTPAGRDRAGFRRRRWTACARAGTRIGTGGYWGDVEAIIRTPAGWQGVSDPRRGGGGAGY